MSFQLQNEITRVDALEGTPSFAKAHHRSKGAKGQGLRYESKVHRYFCAKFGPMYVPGPWFSYRLSDGRRMNYAQPDGLLFNIPEGLVTIVEIKYSHTSDAYFQLVDKYLPLMRFWLGANWTFATCEVVWWYDAAVAFPCAVKLRKEIQLTRPGEFGVHICRPQ